MLCQSQIKIISLLRFGTCIKFYSPLYYYKGGKVRLYACCKKKEISQVLKVIVGCFFIYLLK